VRALEQGVAEHHVHRTRVVEPEDRPRLVEQRVHAVPVRIDGVEVEVAGMASVVEVEMPQPIVGLLVGISGGRHAELLTHRRLFRGPPEADFIRGGPASGGYRRDQHGFERHLRCRVDRRACHEQPLSPPHDLVDAREVAMAERMDHLQIPVANLKCVIVGDHDRVTRDDHAAAATGVAPGVRVIDGRIRGHNRPPRDDLPRRPLAPNRLASGRYWRISDNSRENKGQSHTDALGVQSGSGA
jgi:hypothetical protein